MVNEEVTVEVQAIKEAKGTGINGCDSKQQQRVNIQVQMYFQGQQYPKKQTLSHGGGKMRVVFPQFQRQQEQFWVFQQHSPSVILLCSGEYLLSEESKSHPRPCGDDDVLKFKYNLIYMLSDVAATCKKMCRQQNAMDKMYFSFK